LKRAMKKTILFFILALAWSAQAGAQRVLTLDSCRAMALRNNKEMSIARLKLQAATADRKAARTKYLPTVEGVGIYNYSSREISILNKDQKAAISGVGTSLGEAATPTLTTVITSLTQLGIITPTQAQSMQQIFAGMTTSLDALGQQLVNDFRTDTRNIWGGSILVKQPLYMGGKITAYNKITDVLEDVAEYNDNLNYQTTIYNTDQAYWLVVSLRHKQKLADGYRDLVSKLNDDVQKMIDQGVATRADGLTVSVKLNEAEMSKVQVDDGLSLAKMALCQQCGLPLSEDIVLADENSEDLAWVDESPQVSTEWALDNLPETKMLSAAYEISKQQVKLARADYLPNLALIGGYTLTNPNLFNGFEKRFGGMWHVGVMLKVPIWNWLEGVHKVNAAKYRSNIAQLEYENAREKLTLRISQDRFKVSEAQKKLDMARKNIERAEENLRSANLGFKEGVLSTSNVMEAQTAWLQAQSQKIDAEIDVKLTQVALRKSLGVLE